jgi:hypothetical protein
MGKTDYFRNAYGVIRWRIGPETAFGRGRGFDDYDNPVYHMARSTSIVDRHPTLGSVVVRTSREILFERKYSGVDGTVDYRANMDQVESSEFITQVVNEECYVCDGSPDFSIKLRRGYIFKSAARTVTFSVKDITGAVTLLATQPAQTFTPVIPTLDRFHNGVDGCLFEKDIQLTGVVAVSGDILLVTYSFYHHADCLRDGRLDTRCRIKNIISSNYIDFNYRPDLKSIPYTVNNMEVVSADTSICVTPQVYTLQQGVITSGSNVGFKNVYSGVFQSLSKNGSFLMKPKAESVVSSRLIVSGVSEDGVVEITLSDEALSRVATVDSWSEVRVVPYYFDEQSSDREKSIIQGSPVYVSEVRDKLGVIQLHYNNVLGQPDYSHYRICYFDLKKAADTLYSGVPVNSKTSVFLSGDTTKSEYSDTPGNNNLPIEWDYLDEGTHTRFKNIDPLGVELRVVFPGTVREDYTQVLSGSVITFYDGLLIVLTLDTATGFWNYNGSIVGVDLYLKYKYSVSTGVVSTTKLQSVHTEHGYVEFSEIRIFRSFDFDMIYVNSPHLVTEFEINPAEMSRNNETNQVLVKVLGGGYRKQSIGNNKYAKLSISGQKISDAMYKHLERCEADSQNLGLVTDTLEYMRCTIVPGSLKGQRRKTSATEQGEATTSWSYSLEIQEI